MKNTKVIKASRQVVCSVCGGDNGTIVNSGTKQAPKYRHQHEWMCKAHNEAVAYARMRQASIKNKDKALSEPSKADIVSVTEV